MNSTTTLTLAAALLSCGTCLASTNGVSLDGFEDNPAPRNQQAQATGDGLQNHEIGIDDDLPAFTDCNHNGVPDASELADSPGLDGNNDGVIDRCERSGDINGDGNVNVDDLIVLLAAWGQCPGSNCPGDLNVDGYIDADDLAYFLTRWEWDA